MSKNESKMFSKNALYRKLLDNLKRFNEAQEKKLNYYNQLIKGKSKKDYRWDVTSAMKVQLEIVTYLVKKEKTHLPSNMHRLLSIITSDQFKITDKHALHLFKEARKFFEKRRWPAFWGKQVIFAKHILELEDQALREGKPENFKKYMSLELRKTKHLDLATYKKIRSCKKEEHNYFIRKLSSLLRPFYHERQQLGLSSYLMLVLLMIALANINNNLYAQEKTKDPKQAYKNERADVGKAGSTQETSQNSNTPLIRSPISYADTTSAERMSLSSEAIQSLILLSSDNNLSGANASTTFNFFNQFKNDTCLVYAALRENKAASFLGKVDHQFSTRLTLDRGEPTPYQLIQDRSRHFFLSKSMQYHYDSIMKLITERTSKGQKFQMQVVVHYTELPYAIEIMTAVLEDLNLSKESISFYAIKTSRLRADQTTISRNQIGNDALDKDFWNIVQRYGDGWTIIEIKKLNSLYEKIGKRFQ